MSAIQIRNAHTLLRAAFRAEYQQTVDQYRSTAKFVYGLSDGEAVDWLQQLFEGTVVLDLYYNDTHNHYSPALSEV